MFCRIDIIKGDARRVICTHYKIGADLAAMEEFAERERRFHGGDGFRLYDLHTGKAKRVRAAAN